MRVCSSFFFFNDPPPTEIYTLSLHDALPICDLRPLALHEAPREPLDPGRRPALNDQIEDRSEEHTSELQSRVDLVCRLLLEKKKQQTTAAHCPTQRRARPIRPLSPPHRPSTR